MTNRDSMKAVIFDGPHRVRLGEVPVPRPREGEVLVKVHRATICGTDIRIVDGRKTRDIRYGHPLGHECAGTVAAVGPGVTGYTPGERVAVCVVVSCGECPACRADKENLCSHRITLGYHTGGAFAEYMLIPAHAVRRGNLFRLPDEIPMELAPLLEPMGCCINGQHEMRLNGPDGSESESESESAERSLLILGAGPIGLMHLLLAKAASRAVAAAPQWRVTVVEPLDHRREFATQAGADATFPPHRFSAREEFDAVIIAFGEPKLVDIALRAARKCGKVSFFAGFDKGATAVIDPNLIHYNQLYLSGGSESRRRDYAEALALVRDGRIDLSNLITHTCRLDEYQEALRLARERVGLKVGFELRPES